MDTLDTVLEGGARTEGLSYAEALTTYLERLNAAEAEHFARNYPNSKAPTYVVGSRGRKYDRVARRYEDGGSGGAWCFVEKATGLIWKPASHRGPTLNFPRGDIYALPERPAAAREDPILRLR